MGQAQEITIFNSIENASLVADVLEGKFFPRIIEHADQLRSG
jgi:hypothetical protein